MSSYSEFLGQYRLEERDRHQTLLEIQGAMSRALEPMGSSLTTEGRIKSPISTWRKMQRYGLAFGEVHDVIGLRLVVDTVEECYQALEFIQRAWPGRWERFKDYIATPKANGYQSIHLCVRRREGPRFEIQIRTRAMHRRCETGRAAHGRYKRRRAALSLSIRESLAHPPNTRIAVA